MKKRSSHKNLLVCFVCLAFVGCTSSSKMMQTEKVNLPAAFSEKKDSMNSASIKWKDFFTDKNLSALIDTALKNNLDMLKTLQEIEIAKSDVRFRKGFLFPKVEGAAGTGIEKVGEYTSQGAGDKSAEILPGEIVPENLGDFFIGFHASWEVDVWGKLRNAKKAAYANYLGSIEGKNFVTTNLVAEIANSYYELEAADNRLDIIRETIGLQKNALELIKVQKQAAQVSELGVKQFEAQLLNAQAMEFEILQEIKEKENKINFLLGRYPQPIIRDKTGFNNEIALKVKSGVPSDLLENRPDIKKAEYELYATKCDVKAAKAEFYPSLGITGTVGFQAFKPEYLFETPQSMAYSLIGDLVAPLINRSAIKAEFNKAKARQLEALYEYQKTILDGFTEVSNEMSYLNNLEQEYSFKSQQVEVLNKSIDISNDLFRAARANYLEVLTTQREALESKMELVEIKNKQYAATVNLYKCLGGGWK